MVEQSGTDQIDIRAHQVPQSIRLLRRLGVPATRLAGIFGDTADNIRQIDSRAQKATTPQVRPVALQNEDLALTRLSELERMAQRRRNLHAIRIRTKQDFDLVESTVWTIFQNHKSVGPNVGYETLLAMLPSVANARHEQALRVRLLIEEKLAWFALPLNRIGVALAHARSAMRLARRAFRESAGDKQYLLRYSESALVASVCLQKMRQPEQAFAFIKAADDACEAAGELPGSEHLRQRGVSFLQMGSNYDDRAKQAFHRAPLRMQRKNEARHKVDLQMIGLRQQALVQPFADWDNVQILVQDVAAVYGPQSIQYEVAARFAAAVGLKIATPASILAAIDMLKTIAHSPLAQILAITPELGLRQDHLDRWLRFALYETPVSRKK